MFCFKTLRHGFDSLERKFGMVVHHSNVNKLRAVFIKYPFFSVLRRHFRNCESFLATLTITHERKNKKYQASLIDIAIKSNGANICFQTHVNHDAFFIVKNVFISFPYNIARMSTDSSVGLTWDLDVYL